MPDVEPTIVRGRWSRHVPVGVDPLAVPATPADGRWQRGAAVAATYLADEPDTVWAEWYRALAEAALPPHRALPRDLWVVDVEVEVADLSTHARLAGFGLPVPTPGRAGWAPFQAVGEALHAADWSGLLAPSAARPDHLVLCLFRPNDEHPGLTALSPPRRIARPPIPPRGMTT